MNMGNYLLFISYLFAGLSLGLAAETNNITERPPYAGVWVNTFGKAYDFSPYHHFLAGEAGRPKWHNLQTGPNSYDFAEIREVLERVKAAGHYWYCELWTGPNSGKWIYSNGVPRVNDTSGNLYPYYLDEDYRNYLAGFFKALATYIAGLPEDLRQRIAFLQPGFGSTGDRQLYKGTLKDSQYNINSSQYVTFMRETTLAWYEAFNAHPETADIRFLWNIDDYDGSDPSELNGVSDRKRGEMLYAEWMKQNYNCQLRKQQFTIAIGYMDVNEKNQDEAQRDLFYGTSDPPRWGGNPEFVRGEHNDSKWAETSMAKKALKWHYYWTAISSVDKGLDAWETKPDYLLSNNYNEAFEFSHRYSFYKRPETSPWAFVALRDVLDYSDKSRFPSSVYGSVQSSNLSRINAILAEYAPYGATNDDSDAVMNRGGSNYLLNSKGLNDCVWNVIDRNYRRHMYQIDPNKTSVGWWRVGSKDQPYGRFARAFENSTGKNAMYFKFVDGFITSKPELVEVKVIYFDELTGSTWELRYDNGDPSLATAATVTCSGDGLWKSKTVTLTDAVFAGNGPRGADLALVNTDSLDDKFHLVEVRRAQNFGRLRRLK